jgi:phosphoglycolate phosphatase-like HAD superfamily hydrolase
LNALQSFDVIIGGDSVKSKKPDPEGLNLILKQSGVSPEDAVLIGDSPVDIETGNRAGVHTCVVNYGLGFADEIAAAGPDCSIDCLSELKDIFH